MTRLFLTMATIAALGSVVAGGCKKNEPEKKAAERAAPKAVESPAGEPQEAVAVEPAREAATVEPAAVPTIGIDDCDRYMRRFAACQKLPAKSREVFQQTVRAWQASGEQADRAGAREQWRQATASGCDQAAPEWEQALSAMGC